MCVTIHVREVDYVKTKTVKLVKNCCRKPITVRLDKIACSLFSSSCCVANFLFIGGVVEHKKVVNLSKSC